LFCTVVQGMRTFARLWETPAGASLRGQVKKNVGNRSWGIYNNKRWHRSRC
jgi:hypothetical protein